MSDQNGAHSIHEPRTVLRRDLVVKHPEGMHLRIASCIAQVAQRRQVAVTISNGQSQCDGCSVLGLLTMVATQGTTLSITVDGENAPDVMQAVESLLTRGQLPENGPSTQIAPSATDAERMVKTNGCRRGDGSVESLLHADFRSSSYGGLRGVQVRQHDGMVSIEGRVPTIYHRQLAITLVRRRLTDARIDDRLQVAST